MPFVQKVIAYRLTLNATVVKRDELNVSLGPSARQTDKSVAFSRHRAEYFDKPANRPQSAAPGQYRSNSRY
jgi:hypothetical protein